MVKSEFIRYLNNKIGKEEQITNAEIWFLKNYVKLRGKGFVSEDRIIKDIKKYLNPLRGISFRRTQEDLLGFIQFAEDWTKAHFELQILEYADNGEFIKIVK